MKRGAPPCAWQLALFAVLLFLPEYLQRSLWEPDEARYAYIAQEMRDGGTWAVPHRHGLPYAHKPPLLFWLGNAFGVITGGVNRVSIRLPSLLGAFFSLWVVARLGGRWFGSAAAWKAPLILATSFLFWNKGGTGQMDALLLGLELLGLYHLLTHLEEERPAPWRPAAAYLCFGLAILVKGPVGLLVPMVAWVGYTLASGPPRRVWKAHLAWGPLLALVLPGLWLLWVWLSNPPAGYLEGLLWDQNVGRAVGRTGHHQSLFYYLYQFPVDFLPWSLFLGFSVLAWKAMPEHRSHFRGIAAWGILVLLFFSFSPGKRNLYVLLSFPAGALLIAGAWPAFATRRLRLARGFSVCLLIGLGLAAIGVSLVNPSRELVPFPVWPLAVTGALGLVGGLVLLRETLRSPAGPGVRWFTTKVLAFLIVQLAVANLVYPAANAIKSPIGFVREAAIDLPQDSRLVLYRTHGEIYALYAGVRGREEWTEPGLRQALNEETRGVVLTEKKHWESLSLEMRDRFPNPRTFRMGSKQLRWVPFRSHR